MGEFGKRAHPTDDVLVVCEMRFALSAAVDLVAREICIVRQPHDGLSFALSSVLEIVRSWIGGK